MNATRSRENEHIYDEKPNLLRRQGQGGRQEFLKNGKDFYYVLENEDEIDEFAKKFNMDWYWNMRKGILSFKDKSEGVKLNRPEYVQIGDVVVAYNDWEKWRVDVWTSEEFEKKFIKVD